MKIKYLLSSVAMLFIAQNVCAGDDDNNNLFNHMSVGVTVGTPGVGIDLAMPVGNYVQVRGGVAFVPNIKVTTDLDVDISDAAKTYMDAYNYSYPKDGSIEVEGKTNIFNGKLLFDVFPFKRSSFHLTAGAYVGSSKVVKVYNTDDSDLSGIAKWNTENPSNTIGAQLGDYLLTPDSRGNVEADIKTASFKPYLGIGFGRAVPKTKRVGFMVELGCQFWGSPKVYCNNEELKEDKVGDGDAGGIIKTISKVSVYPVINFRICGKLF